MYLSAWTEISTKGWKNLTENAPKALILGYKSVTLLLNNFYNGLRTNSKILWKSWKVHFYSGKKTLTFAFLENTRTQKL